MENENVHENANVNEEAIENTIADTSTDAKENEIAATSVKGTAKKKGKKKSKGLIIGVFAALVIIAATVVLFIFKPWSAAYVATVDKYKITAPEYIVISKINMQQFLASAGVDANTTIDSYDWNQQKNGEAIKEQIQKDTLNQLQENKIMLIKAEEAGVKLSNEDINNIDSTIIQQYGSEEAAKESIKIDYGVTYNQFKDFYKGLILQQNYIQEEQKNSKIIVTDEEVKKYYDDNPELFEEVTISHIVLSTYDNNGAPVSEGKKSELKKQAENIVTQIKAGKDMKILATENNSSATADNIEMTFVKGQLSTQYAVLADLENWAFANDVGAVGIVDAAYGYDIVRVDKRAVKDFDEIKEDIKSNLKMAKFTEEITERLEGWKKDKKYEIIKNDKVLNKLNLELYGE
ncbi:peptidyl-prolyl cis-trans isomerase [Ruminiclostridium herbifermentans]|uniref:peptidylprolyl isomerase n=1 Tax=Ruminiclostridium herbifermentans TaxID=2488810 RepID=A0A4U7JF94_9FIRM|nr:peptidyl-prolyl cis-trans isomerase [Ruminiclostridium herbifermentans]QNU67433.1 peptidyl-prolyl cis-trans isomerase [Ruminiclostridium herbifermentans]